MGARPSAGGIIVSLVVDFCYNIVILINNLDILQYSVTSLVFIAAGRKLGYNAFPHFFCRQIARLNQLVQSELTGITIKFNFSCSIIFMTPNRINVHAANAPFL